jgi:hypothetical protein
MVAGSILDQTIGFFNLPTISSRDYGPWVDSTPNRIEYQESFWDKDAADA